MRNGKIAKLPVSVRNELNPRMERGESGEAILEWLNGLPVVRTLLKEAFDGVPISKQNLSEWRQGGFREWELREDLFAQAGGMRGFSEEIDVVTLIGNLLAMMLARYAGLMSLWDGEWDPNFNAKVRVLRGLLRDIVMIQRTVRPVAKVEKGENVKAVAKKRLAADGAGGLDGLLAEFEALLGAGVRKSGTEGSGTSDSSKPAGKIKAKNCSSGTVTLPGTGRDAGLTNIVELLKAAGPVGAGLVKPSQTGSNQIIDFSAANGAGAPVYAQRISP